MADRLADRVAIVTGGGSGLGAEAARVLAAQGAKVAIAELFGETGERTADEIRAAGGEATAIQTDLAFPEQVRAMVDQVVARYGRIDILHNNAAFQTREQQARDLDVVNVEIDAWDRAMTVNVRGAFLCDKYVIPHMLRQGRGSIIHVSSGFGAQGDLTLSAYAASKAAIIALSRSVATQYGKQGVRSNAIQLGVVMSEKAVATLSPELVGILRDNHLTPDMGQPRQIADVVAFLASDESSFITGATIPVDGGFSSHVPSMVQMKAYFEKMGSNKI